jgi:hypothetical protein
MNIVLVLSCARSIEPRGSRDGDGRASVDAARLLTWRAVTGLDVR